MATDKVPYVPPALVDHLERTFRDVGPKLDDPARLIWYNAGSVRVVKYLRRLVDTQVKSSSE